MLLLRLKSLFTDSYFLLTLVVCAVVYVFKFQDLFVPYFGDELWAYGPAVRKMGQQIPSLLPNSLAIEDHWGHPLFFFFLGGFWGNIFGSGVVSTHVFASLLSTSFLISFYILVERLFKRKMAFYAVLILSVQSIFLGQFTLVLPEIILTLLMLITLYHYVMQHRMKYILFASCLVLVKETGVILIAAITLWDLIKVIGYEKENPFQWKHLQTWLLLILPVLFLLIHVLLLKYFYGWFLMPERVEAFEWDWDVYYRRIRRAFHYIFVNQGRRPLIFALFIASTLFMKNMLLWKRILIMTLLFGCYKVFFNYWKLPEWIVMTLIPLAFFYFIKLIFLDQYKADKKQGDFIAVSAVFILLYVLFSSSQFDSLRYLFCTIPFVILLTLYFIQKNLKPIGTYLIPVFTVLCFVFSLNYILSDSNFGDDTLNYRKVSFAKQRAIRFLEAQDYFNTNIQAPFLFAHALKRPEVGYLSDKPFTMVNKPFSKTDDGSPEIVVLDKSEANQMLKLEDVKNEYKLIYQDTEKWIEIYKRSK